MERVNVSITSRMEQAMLNKLILLVPRFIGPDFMTVLALLAAVGIGAAYFYAQQYRFLYIIAAILYFVHWLGDSLDGKIARERNRQRPRYGHYVDHILDSISVAVILGGLTASAITFTASWLWVVSGFLLLMTHAFLKASVTGKFEMSLGFVGPTEARIIGAGFSIMLFFTGNPLVFAVILLENVYPFTLLDILGLTAAAAIWIMLITGVLKTAIKLDREDRAKWKTKK